MVATRGTCDRAYVGCVLVNQDNRIVSTDITDLSQEILNVMK